VNVPLSDVTAVRAIGYYNDEGGFIDNLGTLRNDVNASLRRGARVAVRMARPEHLDATLMFAHQERSSPGLNIDNLSLDRYQQRTLMPDAYQDEWQLLSLGLEYRSEGFEIVSATSYLDRWWRQLSDISGFLDFFGVAGTVQADAQQDLNEFAEEIRIGSQLEADDHWLVGLYYLKRDEQLRQTFPAPGFDAATAGLGAAFGAPDNLGMGRTTFDHEEAALFGEWSFLLMRGVQLVVGSRWQNMEEDANSDSAGLLYGGAARTSKHWEGSGFTPNLSALFRPTDAYTLYVTASKGFRTGGPNYAPVPQDLCEESLRALGLARVPESYDSDHVWNYEIGARLRSRDERIALSASAFRINWSDVQILGFLSCGTGFVDNAGTGRTNGVVLEVCWGVGEHLSFDGYGSCVDARLEGDVPILGVEAGDRLPGVPHWTVNASVTYERNITSNVVGYIRTDLQYVDAREGMFVPEGAPRLRAPAYALGNLRLGCEGARWSAALYLRNAWDEYATYARVDDFGLHPSGDWNTVARPRTVGLRIDWRFGNGQH
jgi:outer membrane receptor protein involved in Fe transport